MDAQPQDRKNALPFNADIIGSGDCLTCNAHSSNPNTNAEFVSLQVNARSTKRFQGLDHLEWTNADGVQSLIVQCTCPSDEVALVISATVPETRDIQNMISCTNNPHDIIKQRTYVITNWVQPFFEGDTGWVQTCIPTGSRHSSTYLIRLDRDTAENANGDFVFLDAQAHGINQYVHNGGTITDGPWKLTHTLPFPNGYVLEDTSLSLIQNTQGNLEAVARVAQANSGGHGILVGYEFDQMKGWQPAGNLHMGDHVTGTQALIESTFGVQGQDRYELLVLQGNTIRHFALEPGNITISPFKIEMPLEPLEDLSVVSASLTQSDTDVIVTIARISTLKAGTDDILVGYTLQRGAEEWRGPMILQTAQRTAVNATEHQNIEDLTLQIAAGNTLIAQVTGNQATILTSQGLELLVPQKDVINHYRLVDAALDNIQFVQTLPALDSNVQMQAVSISLVQSSTAVLQLIARIHPPQGNDFMVGYTYDPAAGWSGAVELVDEHGSPIIAQDGSTATPVIQRTDTSLNA